MKKIIKKTVSVGIGREHYIIALMSKMGFYEIERNTTGGYMSEEKIQLTFEGYDQDYHENDYVKVKSPTEGYFYFYSLRHTDGYYTNSVEIFKEIHDKVFLKYDVLSF